MGRGQERTRADKQLTINGRSSDWKWDADKSGRERISNNQRADSSLLKFVDKVRIWMGQNPKQVIRRSSLAFKKKVGKEYEAGEAASAVRG